jgi:hypothetical protein
MRFHAEVLRGLAILGLLALLARPPSLSLAQITEGATMTVLRGSVAVIRTDGSAIQPAPTGTDVFPGDEIRTLSVSGALITFFSGTEIELGDDTVLVVERVSRQGERVDVALKQVAGATLNRVQTFTDAGSAYRIEANGAVMLVRGTTFLLYGPSPDGIVVLICLDGCDQRTLFAGVPVSAFTGYYVEVDRGRVVSKVESFKPDLSAGPWNAAAEGATLAEQAVQGDTHGVPAGQVARGGREEARAGLEHQEREGKDNGQGQVVTTTTQVATTTTTGATTSTTTTATTTTTQTGTPAQPGELGFHCFNRTNATTDCTFTLRAPTGTVIGSNAAVTLQTLVGGEPTTQSRSCGPVSAGGSASCSFNLPGAIFQGGMATAAFSLVGGGAQTLTEFTGCDAPRISGQAC